MNSAAANLSLCRDGQRSLWCPVNPKCRGRANGYCVVNRKIKLVSILVNNVGVSRSHLPTRQHHECGGYVGKIMFTWDLQIRAQNGLICIRSRCCKTVVGMSGRSCCLLGEQSLGWTRGLGMSVINIKSMWPNVSGRPHYHTTHETYVSV